MQWLLRMDIDTICTEFLSRVWFWVFRIFNSLFAYCNRPVPPPNPQTKKGGGTYPPVFDVMTHHTQQPFSLLLIWIPEEDIKKTVKFWLDIWNKKVANMLHRGDILPQYGDPHRGVSVARYNIFDIASAHSSSLLLAILTYDLSLKHTYHNVERQRQHKQQTESILIVTSFLRSGSLGRLSVYFVDMTTRVRLLSRKPNRLPWKK
jgi:hypothetical protein